MNVQSTTISLTVADVASSAAFFQGHLGYRQQMAAEGFVSLARDDTSVDVVLLQQDNEALPEDQRDQLVAGLIIAYTVTDLDAELSRLNDEDVPITLPLQEEEWGERLFQVTDPSGVVIQFVEWSQGSGPPA